MRAPGYTDLPHAVQILVDFSVKLPNVQIKSLATFSGYTVMYFCVKHFDFGLYTQYVPCMYTKLVVMPIAELFYNHVFRKSSCMHIQCVPDPSLRVGSVD